MPITGKNGLTPRQKAFVREYLIDRNATEAYKRAGYKDTPAARHNAARLMANDNVLAAITALSERVADRAAERAELNATYVLKNLQELVERCMQRAPVMDRHGDQATDEAGRHLWTFNPKGACTALIALGNHFNLFEPKPPTPPPGGSIEIVRIKVTGPPVAALGAEQVKDKSDVASPI